MWSREKCSQDINMVFRPYLVSKLGEVRLHFPTDVLPVLTGPPEFLRLWTFPAIRFSYPDGKNSGLPEREDQIAGRDLAHRLVIRIARAVGVALGRPQITTFDFVAVCLVLVDPPITHKPFSSLDSKDGQAYLQSDVLLQLYRQGKGRAASWRYLALE